MKKIIDRALLVGLISIAAAPVAGPEIIYIVLVGVICGGFCYSFFESRVHAVLCTAVGIMGMASETFLFLLPLIVYEECSRLWSGSRRELVIPAAAAMAGALFCLLLPGRDFVAELAGEPLSAVFFAVLIGLGVYMSYVTSECSRLESGNLRLRDDGEEMKRLLIQKNELMRQRRESEIAVARLEERNRIAREIHDNVGHLLSRGILQIGAMQTVYSDEPFNSSLRQVGAVLDEAMTSIRKSVHDLHNESVDLRGEINRLAEQNGVYQVSLDYDMSANVPRKVKYAILSIITEAFENVRKHSDGTGVWITVMEHPAFYQLIFRDNGHPGPVRESGIGLHDMRSRVGELGGSISFDTGKGFKIFANIPKGWEE